MNQKGSISRLLCAGIVFATVLATRSAAVTFSPPAFLNQDAANNTPLDYGNQNPDVAYSAGNPNRRWVAVWVDEADSWQLRAASAKDPATTPWGDMGSITPKPLEQGVKPRVASDNGTNWAIVYPGVVGTDGTEVITHIFFALWDETTLSWKSEEVTPVLDDDGGLNSGRRDANPVIMFAKPNKNDAAQWIVAWDHDRHNLGNGMAIKIAHRTGSGVWKVNTISPFVYKTAEANMPSSGDMQRQETPTLATDGSGHWVAVWSAWMDGSSREIVSATAMTDDKGIDGDWSGDMHSVTINSPRDNSSPIVRLVRSLSGVPVWAVFWSGLRDFQDEDPQNDADIWWATSLNGTTWGEESTDPNSKGRGPVNGDYADPDLADHGTLSVAADDSSIIVAAWTGPHHSGGVTDGVAVQASTGTVMDPPTATQPPRIDWSIPIQSVQSIPMCSLSNCQVIFGTTLATDTKGTWELAWDTSVDPGSLGIGTDRDILITNGSSTAPPIPLPVPTPVPSECKTFLEDPLATALSPDGLSLYVASHMEDGQDGGHVSVFDRNPTSGLLHFLEVITNGTNGTVHGVAQAHAVSALADNRSVCVVSNANGGVAGSPALTLFNRDDKDLSPPHKGGLIYNETLELGAWSDVAGNFMATEHDAGGTDSIYVTSGRPLGRPNYLFEFQRFDADKIGWHQTCADITDFAYSGVAATETHVFVAAAKANPKDPKDPAIALGSLLMFTRNASAVQCPWTKEFTQADFSDLNGLYWVAAAKWPKSTAFAGHNPEEVVYTASQTGVAAFALEGTTLTEVSNYPGFAGAPFLAVDPNDPSVAWASLAGSEHAVARFQITADASALKKVAAVTSATAPCLNAPFGLSVAGDPSKVEFAYVASHHGSQVAVLKYSATDAADSNGVIPLMQVQCVPCIDCAPKTRVP